MDPRQSTFEERRAKSANHSPLMKALSRSGKNEIVNACPFGCPDEKLDESGYCGHLVGFYDGGTTYEPRVVRKDRRIVTSGAARRPMEPGFVRVKITTTARVYSPAYNEKLARPKDAADAVQAQILAEERQLLERAEAIRTPVLEGVWEGTCEYDLATVATPPSAKPA